MLPPFILVEDASALHLPEDAHWIAQTVQATKESAVSALGTTTSIVFCALDGAVSQMRSNRQAASGLPLGAILQQTPPQRASHIWYIIRGGVKNVDWEPNSEDHRSPALLFIPI